ncbi:MAG TPA: DUF1700 domain-containing protein [Bacillota bacterium]|nr:DUF1700 domain-containing protein [Bacillota bacterium]
MSKNEFLKKLDKALAEVPENDRKEILYDYEEHFRNASAAGKTEVEIIDSLGDPESIAKQYLTGNSGKKAETKRLFLAIIAGNGLAFKLCTALLLGILALEVFTLFHQKQVLENQRSYQHQNLVAALQEYQRQAKFINPGAYAGLMKIATNAKHNREAIKKAGEIIAKVQFNTLPVLKIASLAGNADHEVRHLDDLLVVTITYGEGSLKDSMKMVELAKKAVNHEISETKLETAIKYYRAQSRAKSIEEAERNMERAFENL